MGKSKSVLAIIILMLIPTVTVQAQFTIELDYSLDSNNFFGSAGSQQRISLEAARDVYEQTITQSFNAIVPGQTFNQGTPSEFSNTWDAIFSDPGTGRYYQHH